MKHVNSRKGHALRFPARPPGLTMRTKRLASAVLAARIFKTCRSKESNRQAAPKRMHLVHPLLQEVALLQLRINLVRRHGLVLRLAELERLGDRARAAVEVDLHHLGDGLRGQAALLRAVRLDEERERLGDTNGVRELHKSTLRKAALHNRLSHLAADVRRRPVDLGRVLAGERTAAVRTPPTVGVDDDLAPGDTGVALRTADDELARRVDVEMRVVAVQRNRRLAVLEDDLGKALLDHVLNNEL